jgi:hypothetical protein
MCCRLQLLQRDDGARDGPNAVAWVHELVTVGDTPACPSTVCACSVRASMSTVTDVRVDCESDAIVASVSVRTIVDECKVATSVDASAVLGLPSPPKYSHLNLCAKYLTCACSLIRALAHLCDSSGRGGAKAEVRLKSEDMKWAENNSIARARSNARLFYLNCPAQYSFISKPCVSIGREVNLCWRYARHSGAANG